MYSMNGSASAPSSATMNGTREALKTEMKATSRDRRQSFATTTGAFALRAFASAAANCGRRSRASAPHARHDEAKGRTGGSRKDPRNDVLSLAGAEREIRGRHQLPPQDGLPDFQPTGRFLGGHQ